MSKRVVTFGEIMLRLAPEGYYPSGAGGQIRGNLWRRRSECSSVFGKLWI